MDGFFQFGHIFLKYKKEILLYMEANKHKHTIQTDLKEKIVMSVLIDDIILPPLKHYDVVIHIRLDDFNGRPDFIDKQYYLALFETIDFSFMNSICIISDTMTNEEDRAFIETCINWFLERNIVIQLERNDVMMDFNIMKQSKILICSMSTLSWAAAYLSKTIVQCYMPDYNFYEIDNRRYGFFRKPIENTILYPVKTTSRLLSSIKPFIITLPQFSSRLNKLDDLQVKLSSIGLNPLLYYGVNGKDITLKDTINSHLKCIEYNNKNTFYTYDSTIRLNGEGMSKGEIGCALSHINMLKQLLQEPPEVNYYLIMEDDVELVKPINELYDILHHLPANIDICHVAKSNWYDFVKTKRINYFLYECKKLYFNNLTAYIVSKQGAEKILLNIENAINVPADDLINMIYRLMPDFNLYVPSNYLFKVQDNVKSTIIAINNQIEQETQQT
jgi:GR25 family glycosyltransferase involved in LPS biosynthesis